MISKVKPIAKYLLVLISLSLALASCSDNKFKIKGEIYGGEDKTIILEKSDFQGRWLPVDSTKINKNGGFSLSFPTPLAPDIYRLSLNHQYVYIPVDATETITLETSYDKFGHDFNLSGSKNAEMLTKFEKDLQSQNLSDSASMVTFKRNVYSNYMKDFQGSILGFYILTKTVDGQPLYNPSDKNDGKYFSAVATGFKSMRPNDPHTALLEQTAVTAMKRRNNEEGKFQTLEAEEITVLDMDLQNEYGQNVKLSSLVGKGKPVVVIFSLLNHQDSPEFNMALAKIYNRNPGKVEFYNVSLDEDQYAWREAAKNLPWVTVYSPGQSSSADAVRYNAFQIPSFYIYNAEGELVERPMTLDELSKALK